MAGLRGDGGWRGWLPGVSGEDAAQDGHDVLAVLAGGVDVAADVEPVLGRVLAGEVAGDFLLGLTGRTPRSLMLFVGQTRVSVVNRSTACSRSRQEFEQVAAGALFRGVLRARDAADLEMPTVTARRNSRASGAAASAGIAARPASRAPCQAWIRPRSARCAWAGQCAPGYASRSPRSPQQVSQACLVPGDVRPFRVEVVHVPVGDHHACEGRRDPQVADRLQGPGAQGTAASTPR